MNKNEILDKSRKENKKLDEMERDALYRAGYMASVVGGLLCICLPLLESILMRKINHGPWIIFFAMDATMLLVRFIYLKKKHELIIALVLLILSGWFLFFY